MLNGMSVLRPLFPNASPWSLCRPPCPHPHPHPQKKAPVGKKKAQEACRLCLLITKAVAASKECSGLSLAVLKKALVAATGQDMDKNSSQIQLDLEPSAQVPPVPTTGAGALGSFMLNDKT